MEETKETVIRRGYIIIRRKGERTEAWAAWPVYDSNQVLTAYGRWLPPTAGNLPAMYKTVAEAEQVLDHVSLDKDWPFPEVTAARLVSEIIPGEST